MVKRRPVLFKASISNRLPDCRRCFYHLEELGSYIGESPESILDSGVNGGPLVNQLSPLDLLIANCDCGTCLGDHLVQDMGTRHWVPDPQTNGQTCIEKSTHPRQWHAHNCILAFSWRFFLDPKILENLYVPQTFGDQVMAKAGKVSGRHGDPPEARIARTDELSNAFWNIAAAKDDATLCWSIRDVAALGNADRVPVL